MLPHDEGQDVHTGSDRSTSGACPSQLIVHQDIHLLLIGDVNVDPLFKMLPLSFDLLV